MIRTGLITLVLLLAMGTWSTNAAAQGNSDTYSEGAVWEVTMIRTHANMHDDYLKRLKSTWGSTMHQAKMEGLILDYKILSGAFANEDDYNLLLMIKFQNLGVLDPNSERDAKWDAIEKKVRSEMGSDAFDNTVHEYDEMREFQGHKIMRELMFNY